MPYSLFMFPSTMCFLGSPVKLYNCAVLCFYILSKLRKQTAPQKPKALGWVLEVTYTERIRKRERGEIWSLLGTGLYRSCGAERCGPEGTRSSRSR